MDTTREMIEWISQQQHFTYVQFSKQFNIPYNQVKKVFTKKLKKYHYKLRKNCLVYHRVTKIEEVNIEVGGYNLAYKVHCSKEFFYIPKHIVSIYGMPIIGSYFSPLHFLTIKGIRIELVYVISFLTKKKFYTIFKLSDDLENWEKKYNWKIVLKKFNAKYKFKNNVTVIRAINLLKGNTKENKKSNNNTNNKKPERKHKLKAIDLFAGIGGFHTACKENSIDVIWASEIDKFARTQYQLNHGLIPQGDITKLKVEEIPKHDLLCAGFPCQSFSNAGKKMGLEDTRGTLFYEIARIVAHHKTPYFLLENVPNLLSINNGEIIKVIQDVFQELGYYLKIKILNAADFGLGQLRKRVFIVGFLDKEKYFRFSFPQAYEYKVVLKDILEEEVDEKYFIKNEKIFRHIEKIGEFKACKIDPELACTLMARQYASWDGNYITDQIAYKNTSKQGERVWGDNALFPTLTQNPEFVQVNRVAEALGGIRGYRVYSEKNQSISLCANGGGFAQTGLYSVENRIRKLTPRECARLQGFPEDYKIECSDSQAYKQFGNAVPVPVVSAILKNILKVI